jgi:hypothetical protein
LPAAESSQPAPSEEQPVKSVEDATKRLTVFFERMKNLQYQKFALFGGLISEVGSLLTRLETTRQVLDRLAKDREQSVEPAKQGQLSTQAAILAKFFKCTSFKYQIVLSEEMQNPVYKDRNFSISLKLTDGEGRLV